MGGLLDRGSSGVDLFLMRTILLILSMLVCSPAWAGFASAVIGGGAAKTGGSWSVKGAQASAANGAFNTPATVYAAGKAVQMPASASFAANAASFAVGAVRLNPTGLLIGAVAPWLLSKGIEYANGAWDKETAANSSSVYSANGFSGGSATSVAEQYYAYQKSIDPEGWKTWVWSPTVTWVSCPIGTFTVSTACIEYDNASAWRVVMYNAAGRSLAVQGTKVAGPVTCPGGTTLGGDGACHAVPSEADWTLAGQGALPDPVAQQLAQLDVPIPVNDPVIVPTPQVVDYGSPYIDPVTGKTVQSKTRITPDPTTDDPYNVRIETYNVEVAPAPAPVPGEPPPVPPEEQPKDPCLDNPDRIGCLNAGSPEDPTLQSYSVPFSLNPVSIGGAGACPPNPVLNVHGMSLTVNYGPMCDAAAWLKPLVLALAWFAAAGIIAGAVRES